MVPVPAGAAGSGHRGRYSTNATASTRDGVRACAGWLKRPAGALCSHALLGSGDDPRGASRRPEHRARPRPGRHPGDHRLLRAAHAVDGLALLRRRDRAAADRAIAKPWSKRWFAPAPTVRRARAALLRQRRPPGAGAGLPRRARAALRPAAERARSSPTRCSRNRASRRSPSATACRCRAASTGRRSKPSAARCWSSRRRAPRWDHSSVRLQLFGGAGKARIFASGARGARRSARARSSPTQLSFQEYVPGGDDAIWSFHGFAAPGGEVLEWFVGRKIRTYPALTGDSSYLRLARDERLVALGRDIAARLGLAGIFKMDFKRSATSGRFYLLEINTRFNLWHYLGACNGVNLPQVAYDYLLHGKRPLHAEARHRCALALPALRLARLQGSARSGELTLAGWLLSLAHAPKVYDLFSWSDPLPFVRHWIERSCAPPSREGCIDGSLRRPSRHPRQPRGARRGARARSTRAASSASSASATSSATTPTPTSASALVRERGACSDRRQPRPDRPSAGSASAAARTTPSTRCAARGARSAREAAACLDEAADHPRARARRGAGARRRARRAAVHGRRRAHIARERGVPAPRTFPARACASSATATSRRSMKCDGEST